MNTPLDPDELISQQWPRHGPYSPERLESAADAIGELVRYLNYATGQGSSTALPYAAHGYRLLGNLHTAADGHEQLLTQLAQWASTLRDDPTLRHAEHRHTPERHRSAADQAARAATDSLVSAGALAKQLGAALQAAQSHLAGLEHRATEAD